MPKVVLNVAGYGAFGKIPSLGDFFRLDTPVGFVSVWDTWLQDGMMAARNAIGPGWQESYMSAPIWRFMLGAGLAGKSSVIGVLMPSVDRVGRIFPLTLMAPTSTHGRTIDDQLFEHLEEIALDALDETMTRDVLAARLAGLGTAPEAPSLTGSLWRTAPAQGDHSMTFAGLPAAAQMRPFFETQHSTAQEVPL